MSNLELHYQQLVKNQQIVVKKVLKNEIAYKRLILEGEHMEKYPSCVDEETRKQFWMKLGETVTELRINCFASELPLKKYLPNLRQLNIIDRTGKFTLEWIKENFVGIEDIGYFVGPSGYHSFISVFNLEEHRDHKIEVKEHFEKILELFCSENSSLNSFTFNCDFRLEAESINEVFSWVNFNYLEMDEVIFDYSPLEDVNKMIVKKIKMEVNRELNRVLIKPITIYVNCANIHEVVKSESVTTLTFNSNFCFECFKTSIKSFPCITSLVMQFKSFMILGGFQFPEVNHLSVFFKKTSDEQFDPFFKCFPSLTSLKVRLIRTISTDACLEIISNNLKNLMELKISSDIDKITASGLTLLETHTNFQKIEKLFFDSSEIKSNIATKKIFKFLSKLKVLKINYKVMLRENFESEEEESTSQINAVKRQEGFLDPNLEQNINIKDLPPEILEQIFSCLVPTSRLPCREVCQLWFNILSTSMRCDRTLNLSGAYLTWNSSPVKLFMNTKFQYNEIIFNQKTAFNKQETFGEFWKKIGHNVQSICLLCHDILGPNNAINCFHIDFFPNLKKLTIYLHIAFRHIFHDFKSSSSFESILARMKILRFDYEYDWAFGDTEFDFELPELEELQIVPTFLRSYVEKQNVYIINFPFCLRLNNFPNLSRMLISVGKLEAIKLLFDEKINFAKLKVLVIVCYEKWSMADVELIINHCPNLQSLGLGYATYGINTDFDNIFSGIKCESIAKVLFENLVQLRNAYFGLISYKEILFKDENTIGYIRKSVNTLKKKKMTTKIFNFLKNYYYYLMLYKNK